jgi:hypothetical protein
MACLAYNHDGRLYMSLGDEVLKTWLPSDFGNDIVPSMYDYMVDYLDNQKDRVLDGEHIEEEAAAAYFDEDYRTRQDMHINKLEILEDDVAFLDQNLEHAHAEGFSRDYIAKIEDEMEQVMAMLHDEESFTLFLDSDDVGGARYSDLDL